MDHLTWRMCTPVTLCWFYFAEQQKLLFTISTHYCIHSAEKNYRVYLSGISDTVSYTTYPGLPVFDIPVAYHTNQICTNRHQYTRPLLLAVVVGSAVAMCVCFVSVRAVSVLQYKVGRLEGYRNGQIRRVVHLEIKYRQDRALVHRRWCKWTLFLKHHEREETNSPCRIS